MERSGSGAIQEVNVTLLKATTITKNFAGVQALKDVTFNLRAGEVHALVGENGAGKSTLIKIITGAVQHESGSVEINGVEMAGGDPLEAKRLGIRAIYQQPALFPDLTVAENISLANESGKKWRRVDWRMRWRRAGELLERIGANIDPATIVSNLTMPEQQLVEIARALGAESKVLIMDEPTASLTEGEVEKLFDIIRDLRAAGVGMIYVSHRLNELFQIADRVTVLRDGATVETRFMSEVTPQTLIQLMVGRELTAIFPKREVKMGEVMLETRNLSCRASGVRDVSLSVRAGEILGLAGLIGAGRTELAKTLFGLTPADEGEILIRGKSVRINDPAQAIAHGMAYVPEDRRRHGVVLGMSVADNTTLSILRSVSRSGFLDFKQEASIASDYTARLRIKTPSIFAPVGNLSGGNQQKVALSRWLAAKPSVIILDEPTQGVDVGAKSEIHALMVDLAERGMAVVMISSELPEILGMSDRIAVMCGGTVTGIVNRSDATPQKILALALQSNRVESVRDV